MEITQAPYNQTIYNPDIRFEKNEFDQLIYDKGYNVYWDKALRCPCKVKSADSLSNCLNCGGSGWVYINRTQTKVLLQGMNYQTQFKDWSETNVGTVKISTRDTERIGYMDRLVLIDAETLFSEIVYPIFHEEELFVRPYYEITELLEIYAFDESKKPLIKFEEGKDYQLKSGKIFFNVFWSRKENFRLSLRYLCKPQFHVIDLTRDIANFEVFNQKNQLENLNFPLSAVGRRSHYVLDVNNFEGSILFDNSK